MHIYKKFFIGLTLSLLKHLQLEEIKHGGMVMTIKQASEITGLSIDTLRYYERIGLIPEVPRNSSGIREYDDAILSWIEFVMRFKRSGMKLEAIRDYLKLAIEGDSTKQQRKEILIEAKKELEAKQTEIRESLEIINYKLDNYEQECVRVTAEITSRWKALTENGNA